MVFNAKYGFFNCDIKTHKVVQKYEIFHHPIYIIFSNELEINPGILRLFEKV